jgi:hypothetical protein
MRLPVVLPDFLSYAKDNLVMIQITRVYDLRTDSVHPSRLVSRKLEIHMVLLHESHVPGTRRF